MVPVSVRPIEARGTTGNQIALWATPLPIAETDPRRRLAAVAEITAGLKHSKQALGAEVLAAVSEWTVPTLLSLASRVAYRNRASNLVVTNVPGPQLPLFLLGARVLETYPMLNLLTRQSLGRRALLVRRAPALGLHRGLGPGAGPPRLRRRRRTRLRRTLRGRRSAATGLPGPDARADDTD